MYGIVSNIIDHVWQSNYSSDQQYIYYICGALICIVLGLCVDGIFRFFRNFLPRWNRD